MVAMMVGSLLFDLMVTHHAHIHSLLSPSAFMVHGRRRRGLATTAPHSSPLCQWAMDSRVPPSRPHRAVFTVAWQTMRGVPASVMMSRLLAVATGSLGLALAFPADPFVLIVAFCIFEGRPRPAPPPAPACPSLPAPLLCSLSLWLPFCHAVCSSDPRPCRYADTCRHVFYPRCASKWSHDAML